METFIPIRVDGEYIDIPYADIIYIEADNKYVQIFTAQDSFAVRGCINSFEKLLPTHQFYRTHRSYIISLYHVTKFSYRRVQLNRISLPVGIRYRKKFRLRARKQCRVVKAYRAYRGDVDDFLKNI